LLGQVARVILSGFRRDEARRAARRRATGEEAILDAHLREILDLLVRWFHFIAGIMWVGNSMLFNWLDRNLVKPENAPPLLDGEIWMLHSGGFYYVEKKQLEPGQVPEQLHWFKWQNGFTWLSGILLLVIVYYMGGAAYMVDPAIAKIDLTTAVAIGVGTLIGSWAIYDGIWRSPLSKNTPVASTISFVLLGAIIYGLCHVLSGRAAYIHVGALMGTLMTGNVWMHIIPSQRSLVALTQSGQPQDKALAWRAKQRSIHNNYMTFPVLFLMVSNHFPSTYGSPLNWLILIVLSVASAGIRHFMNIRFYYKGWGPALAGCAVVGIGVLFALTLPKPTAQAVVGAEPVSFAAVRPIMNARCLTCHSQKPIDPMFATAPAGLMFDTPEQIKAAAARIKAKAVDSTYMPLGNATNMTDEERLTLGRWIDAGAPIQ
jgi:uncharacterized membrane protein